MTKAQTAMATPLETTGYTHAEMRWQLARVRGKRVPDRTLRWWLSELFIQPDEVGLYSEADLKILVRLVLWLKRRGTVAAFRQVLLEELNNAD